MASVSWSTLEPGQTETVIGVLLCLANPAARRIRASKGDGGIDVMVQAEVETVDVYQIKYFATPLDESRKEQIRKSLRRIRRNEEVSVRNWILTTPLNPSVAELNWFDSYVKRAPFNCRWMGLDEIEGLASKYPEVIDYYLHDGRDRLDKSISDLRSLAGLTRPDHKDLVEPLDLLEPLTATYRLLNQSDPHYRYEFEVGKPSEPWDEKDRPGMVASVTSGVDDVAVTHRIFARHAMASSDAPIPLKFEVHATDLDDESLKAWTKALRFGTPAQITVRNVVSDLPGGLNETVELAGMRIAPVPRPKAAPYRLKLRILDPNDQVISEAVIEMKETTQGTEGGSRAAGTEVGGSFDFECLLDPLDFGNPRISLSIQPTDPAGKAPAELEPGVRFLSSCHAPNRLTLSRQYGPSGESPYEFPSSQSPVNDSLVDLITALSLLQREVDGDIEVPDLEAVTPGWLWEVQRAARLIRGEAVYGTWDEQRLPEWTLRDLPSGPVQIAMQTEIPLTIGERQIRIAPVVVVWQAAEIVIVEHVSGPGFVARPALGNNVQIIKRGTTDDVPPFRLIS
jgi:hypothetical protein